MNQKNLKKIFALFLPVFYMAFAAIALLLIIRIGVTASERKSGGEKFVDAILKIAIPNFTHLPVKISHPFIQTKTSDNPDAYNSAPKENVHHASMQLTPYVMYAPTRGGVSGDFHSNQQFRYPGDLKEKEKNEIRIFVTGGSTAWGSMAPDLNSTISAFLEKELNADNSSGFIFRVVNAAAGGWNTTEERIWIQNRITEFEPDMIISYSGHNDINYMTDVNEGLRDIFTFVHNDAGYFFEAIKEYDGYNIKNRPFPIYQDTSKEFYKDSDFPRKTLKNIQMIASYLNFIDVPYVFALQPLHKKSSGMEAYPPKYEILARELELKKNTAGAKFFFVNHSNFFDGQEKYFVDSVHFGDRGYEIIAKDLKSRIQELIQKIIAKRKKI